MVGAWDFGPLIFFLSKSQLVSVEPNLSRNPRVCLGFRLPRGKALVHGEEGSLRIGEEKALEFYNFFFQIYQRKWEMYFLFFHKTLSGIAQVCQGLQPLGEEGGAPGTWAPPKNFKVPARVCGTCPGMPGSARGSDALGGTLRSMARREGRLGLGLPEKFAKSQLVSV